MFVKCRNVKNIRKMMVLTRWWSRDTKRNKFSVWIDRLTPFIEEGRSLRGLWLFYFKFFQLIVVFAFQIINAKDEEERRRLLKRSGTQNKRPFPSKGELQMDKHSWRTKEQTKKRNFLCSCRLTTNFTTIQKHVSFYARQHFLHMQDFFYHSFLHITRRHAASRRGSNCFRLLDKPIWYKTKQCMLF